MATFIEIAANDQSIVYLGQIFGIVGGSLGGGKGLVVLAGSGSGILGAMFRVFNTGLLAVGALIVAYTTIVGVLKTASEGEFLGKWHSLWVPLRTVIGIAGLMPTNTGYCIMQMIIMWIILQGVAVADSVWTGAINYLQSGGATQISASNMASAGSQQDIQNLFSALVCQAGAKAKYDKSYWCFNNASPYCSMSDSQMLNVTSPQYRSGYYAIGPLNANGGACGNLALFGTLQSSGDLPQLTAARMNAYAAIIPALGQIAKKLVDIDYVYSKYMNTDPPATNGPPLVPPAWIMAYCNDQNIPTNSCNMNNPSMPQIPTASAASSLDTVKGFYWKYVLNPYTGGNFLQQNIAVYQGYTLQAMTTSSNSKGVMAWGATLDTTGLLNEARANGWITAGGYYYAIANLGNSTQQGLNKQYVVMPTQDGAPLLYSQVPPFSAASQEVQNKIDTLTKEASALMSQINSEQAAGNNGVTSGSSCNVPFIGDLCTLVMTKFMGALTGGTGLSNSTNAIISLQVFGESVLITIEIVFAVLLVLIFASVSAASTMNSLQGFGFGLSQFYTYAMLPILFLLGALFVFAGTLAVYIPMIPYIIFTFGAIGWFIATIEAMIAAPIVSLAIMHPEGEHEIWGKAKPAIDIIFNIFLRPTLMIFGMIAGMQLSYVVIRFINAAFAGVMSQVNPMPGPVELLLFLAIYTSLIVTSLNKCFALIHMIPDQALRWVGIHGVSFGGEKGLEEVGGAAEKAAGQVKAGAGGAAEKGMELGKKREDQIHKGQEAAGKNRAATGISATPPAAAEEKNNNQSNEGK